MVDRLVFELYRAIYPVIASTELERDTSRSTKFSNDCLYLSDEIRKVAFNYKDTSPVGADEVVSQLQSSANDLEVLGNWWFSNAVVGIDIDYL